MKKFFYYLSLIALGASIVWEMTVFFEHWDQVLSRKEELKLHLWPLGAMVVSYIAFMNLKD